MCLVVVKLIKSGVPSLLSGVVPFAVWGSLVMHCSTYCKGWINLLLWCLLSLHLILRCCDALFIFYSLLFLDSFESTESESVLLVISMSYLSLLHFI